MRTRAKSAWLVASIICGLAFISAPYAADDHDDHSHEEHDDHDHDGHDHENHDDNGPEGPMGGRLLEAGDFAVEITVYENGVAPEFRVYGYHDDGPLPPQDFGASIRLERLGGRIESFETESENAYRRGIGVVAEPHSYDVTVTATYGNASHEWHYENHEGRTQIPDRVATAAGIGLGQAGPSTIVEAVKLTGTLEANPANISAVRGRFPGVARRVFRQVGDEVGRGDRLAQVESNESLRTFDVTAPIGGLIVDQSIQPGQVVGDAPLFVIASLNTVWAQLDLFGNDLDRVRVGQLVKLKTFTGSQAEGVVDWISPLVAHGSQSARARVVVDNSAGNFRPGQFVTAEVVVATHDVELAVARSALQAFRESDVVFAKIEDTYEVRMVELGRRDDVHVEVLSGLDPGTVYVTENSYLIKADIEKSGASHDH